MSESVPRKSMAANRFGCYHSDTRILSDLDDHRLSVSSGKLANRRFASVVRLALAGCTA